MAISQRDPETGDLNFKLEVDIQLVGQTMPAVYNVTDWAGLRKFLGTADFRKLAGRIEFMTVTNREAQ